MYNAGATAQGLAESNGWVVASMMRKIFSFLLLLAATVSPAWAAASPRQNGPLSADQVKELLARVAEHQHRNDEALLLYERRERRVTRKKEDDRVPEEDKLLRVVPTGTGTVKLVLEESGKPVSAGNYREQLRYLEQALAWALDPSESKQKSRVQKWERRAKERYDSVEAARDAFTCSWVGREELNGRLLVKLSCVANPAFKPGTRAQEMFTHAQATLWIEPRAAQLARVEAQLASDLGVGGGILGKAYRGSSFVLEQTEIAPTVWLPSRIYYNLHGRKFVFGFSLHEETIVTQYRRIGPPAEALAAVRAEMADKQPDTNKASR